MDRMLILNQQKIMRNALTTLALAAIFSTAPLAGPLQKSQIPADAKWLIHLDVDAFLGTKLGQFISQDILAKQLAKPKADLKQTFGLDLDWNRLNSVTVYGTDYGAPAEMSGVLIIKTDPKTEQSLTAVMQGIIAQKALQNAKLAGIPIELVQDQPPLYAINTQLFIAPHKDGRFLVSKSRGQIQKASEVFEGKAGNVASARTFSTLLDEPKSFFFLAVAEGFGEQLLKAPDSSDAAKAIKNFGEMPQAQILRMADGGRIALGETSERLSLNLALKAKNAETSRNMQQIVQGIIALISLSQGNNPDLQQLVQSAKVTCVEKIMSVNIECPVATLLQKVNEAFKLEKSFNFGPRPQSEPSSKARNVKPTAEKAEDSRRP